MADAPRGAGAAAPAGPSAAAQGKAAAVQRAISEVIARHCELPKTASLVTRYRTHKGELLGTGAYGEVYRAKLLDGSGRIVAAKIINKAVLGQKPVDEALCVFREIAILRHIKMTLPKVVRDRTVAFVEAYATTRNIIIATELCNKKDLLQRICGSIGDLRMLHELNIAFIIQELTLALDGLHRGGIIHRDIKPENVLTVDHQPPGAGESGAAAPRAPGDPGFRVVLADFGFAHSQSLFPDDMFAGRRLGTPTFAAPEVVRRGEHSFAADMFSLGMVAHVLCSGGVPFVAFTWEAAKKAIDTHPVTLGGPVWAARSPECRDFVGKLLADDPADRLTAAAALEHPFLKQLRTAASSPSGDTGAGSHAPHAAELAMKELRAYSAHRRWQRINAACSFGCLFAKVRNLAMRTVPVLDSALGSSGGSSEDDDEAAPSLHKQAPQWDVMERTLSGTVHLADDVPAVPAAPAGTAGLAAAAGSIRTHSPSSKAGSAPMPDVRRLVGLFQEACPPSDDGAEPSMSTGRFRDFLRRHLVDASGPGRAMAGAQDDGAAGPALPGRPAGEATAAPPPGPSSSCSDSSSAGPATEGTSAAGGSSPCASTPTTAVTPSHGPAPSASASCSGGQGVATSPGAGVASSDQVNDMALDALCAVFDRDGDGRVDVTELCSGLSQLPGSRSTALSLLFGFADTDGDGRLSAEEIAGVMRAQAGPNRRQEQQRGAAAARLLEDADTDKDGFLSLEELWAAIRSSKEVREALLAPPLPRRSSQVERDRLMAEAAAAGHLDFGPSGASSVARADGRKSPGGKRERDGSAAVDEAKRPRPATD